MSLRHARPLARLRPVGASLLAGGIAVVGLGGLAANADSVVPAVSLNRTSLLTSDGVDSPRLLGSSQDADPGALLAETQTPVPTAGGTPAAADSSSPLGYRVASHVEAQMVGENAVATLVLTVTDLNNTPVSGLTEAALELTVSPTAQSVVYNGEIAAGQYQFTITANPTNPKYTFYLTMPNVFSSREVGSLNIGQPTPADPTEARHMQSSWKQNDDGSATMSLTITDGIGQPVTTYTEADLGVTAQPNTLAIEYLGQSAPGVYDFKMSADPAETTTYDIYVTTPFTESAWRAGDLTIHPAQPATSTNVRFNWQTGVIGTGTLTATVTDGSGAPVTGLTADDFILSSSPAGLVTAFVGETSPGVYQFTMTNPTAEARTYQLSFEMPGRMELSQLGEVSFYAGSPVSPTSTPTTAPSTPTQAPSTPTTAPTTPTTQPTATQSVTTPPTTPATSAPTSQVPSTQPTDDTPTQEPTQGPTIPTTPPTTPATSAPTSQVPTSQPTATQSATTPPTTPATSAPTSQVPSTQPTDDTPTQEPTQGPTIPTTPPTTQPTEAPSTPTTDPTADDDPTTPTTQPTSQAPTTPPTTAPTSSAPATQPTQSTQPTVLPSQGPTTTPTSDDNPTAGPTSQAPTTQPTQALPTPQPTQNDTVPPEPSPDPAPNPTPGWSWGGHVFTPIWSFFTYIWHGWTNMFQGVPYLFGCLFR
ncbi:MAG: hypothetical protein LBM23_09185 [Propionibacteriaceae bacterium]|jgi:hypothetical protein|nr:hypothetical protein [Propionibacteriaceae bacterium]